MKLQLVNFEQAKILKKLGFPQDLSFRECDYWYNKYGYDNHHTELIGDDFSFSDIVCLAPTLELVAKWFRDEKSLSLEPYRTAAGWICMIVDIPSGTDKYQVGYNDGAGDDKSSGQFTTFEKALSASIDKAIEMLKNKE